MNLNKMFCIKIAIVFLSASILSGCSFIYGEDGLIKDSSNDYLKAKQTADLRIPENLSQKNKADYAQVPDIGTKAKNSIIGSKLQSSAPLQILTEMDNVRLDKKSEFPAVFIQEENDFLWQSLVDLFQSNSVTPQILNKKDFLLNTGWISLDEYGVWLVFDDETEIEGYRAKFQLKMSPGNIAGETRLEVIRQSAQKQNEGTESWENMESFWQDSALMMNLLLANYEQKVSKRNSDKHANTIFGFKVRLGTDLQNNPALITKADKELIWDKIPGILAPAKLAVSDKDRRSMTYFLEYEKEEAGFFASLFSEEEETLPLEDGNYQVVLSDLGEQTAITFNDAQGEPLEANLMVKLFPKLSELFGAKQ